MSEPWHLGVLAAFDLETTGKEPGDAHVVTAAIVPVDGSGKIPPEPQTWLLDPGVEIGEEASAIHGITTEYAREHGHPAGPAIAEISAELVRCARASIPVVAYNAVYDMTVLDRETRRHGLVPFWDDFDAAKGLVIDPFVLDKAIDPYRKGSRKLEAACEFYRVRIDGARDAAHDAIAAARVAWRIAQGNPHIARMSPTELYAWQVVERRRQATSLQKFKRSQGSAEIIDGSWPVKPWVKEAAA